MGSIFHLQRSVTAAPARSMLPIMVPLAFKRSTQPLAVQTATTTSTRSTAQPGALFEGAPAEPRTQSTAPATTMASLRSGSRQSATPAAALPVDILIRLPAAVLPNTQRRRLSGLSSSGADMKPLSVSQSHASVAAAASAPPQAAIRPMHNISMPSD